MFANGGSGLIGNSGRKTASVCDKHAKETIRNIATDFTGFAFIIFYGKRAAKFLKRFRKRLSEPERLGEKFMILVRLRYFELSRDSSTSLGMTGAESIDHAQARPHRGHFHGN